MHPCIQTHVCTYACVNTCTKADVHGHMPIPVCTYTYYMFIYVDACMYVHVYML